MSHRTEILLNKNYDAEGLYDASRDFQEVLDEAFNPVLKTLPKDEHGFIKGNFNIMIVWDEEEQ